MRYTIWYVKRLAGLNYIFQVVLQRLGISTFKTYKFRGTYSDWQKFCQQEEVLRIVKVKR